MQQNYIFIHAKTEKETDAAVLVRLSGGVSVWLPKSKCVRISGGFWKVPEWLATEKKLMDKNISPEFDDFKATYVVEPELNYAGKLTPFAHQRAAFEKVKGLKNAALFMEMGTGKTKVALDLIAARLAAGLIDKAVWFGPVNVLGDTRRQLVFNGYADLPIMFFGLESLSASERVYMAALEAISEKTMLVIDEAHLVKNPEAIRSERIKIIARKCVYTLGLTGTPITQGPADLFGIFTALDPSHKIIGYKTKAKFEREHLVIDRKNDVIGYINVDKLTERIAPYVYQITKSECLDLPPKLFSTLTSEAYATKWNKAEYVAKYHEIKNEALKKYGETHSAQVILKMLGELHIHAGGGRWLRETGQTCGKIQAARAWLQETDGVLRTVWFRYSDEIKAIKVLGSPNEKYFELHGGVQFKERAGIMQAWRESGNGILLVNLQTGGVGIDLTACSTTLFYSNSFSYANRLQAEDRFHRIGQMNSVNYYDLLSCFGIDDMILRCLTRKGNLRDEFLEMVKNNQEKDFFGSL